jgi:transposase
LLKGISVKQMAEVYQVPERTIEGLLAHERETGTMGVDTSMFPDKPI